MLREHLSVIFFCQHPVSMKILWVYRRNGTIPCYAEIAASSHCLEAFPIAAGAKVVLALVARKSGNHFNLPSILTSFVLSTLLLTSHKYLSPQNCEHHGRVEGSAGNDGDSPLVEIRFLLPGCQGEVHLQNKVCNDCIAIVRMIMMLTVKRRLALLELR